MVPRLEAKMIRLIGYSAPRAAVAPAALPGIGMSAILPSPSISNFGAPRPSIPRRSLETLVIEELHLDRVLVRGVADLRRHVRVGTLHVEVVSSRVPRESGLPALVVIGVAGGLLKVLMLVADPRHDF